MTTIVDSIRKHQKMIVLGAALAVITLYMVPFDQFAFAGPRADAMHARLQKIIDRLNSHGLTSQAAHLADVQYKVVGILNSHGL